MNIGAAEAIDRLLGVAHRDEVAGERVLEDLPLHWVGVLELVDEHQLVATVQRLHHGRAVDRIGDGIAQTGDEIVVPEFLACASPAAHLIHRQVHKFDPAFETSRCVVLVRREGAGGRRGDGTGVAEHSGDRPLQFLQHLRRPAVVLRPVEHVRVGDKFGDDEIAAHLVDDLRGAVAEFGVQPDAGPQAQLAECLLAETVDRGDGGVVEGGDGSTQSCRALGDRSRGFQQDAHPWLVGGGGTVLARRQCLHQRLAAAVAEFGGRGLCERDDQQR
ncbi:unannotated protein [freshwater metagenome]|uniref:Unannotated protein n=1 Tax=freshwater metagenome TaxID=449393 RepID=A0A6J6A7B8_9ZZZZ